MLMEHLILAAMWLFGIVGFILFIPCKDRRKGLLAFMMFQAAIWLCDMPSFQYGLISSPVRIFPKATDLSITINYIFYPVVFSIYYVHKKEISNRLNKFIYFFIAVSIVTLFDVIIERYTDLLDYGFMTWYLMWIYIGFLFFVSQVLCDWFLKDRSLFPAKSGGINEN